jgi:hypothetical protein
MNPTTFVLTASLLCTKVLEIIDYCNALERLLT